MSFIQINFNTVGTGLLLGTSLLLGSGCSMCCGVSDYDYPTYGGLVQRQDSSYGRVGSIFSDPNAPAGIPQAVGVQPVSKMGAERPESPDAGPTTPLDDGGLEKALPKPLNTLSEQVSNQVYIPSSEPTQPGRIMARPTTMLQGPESYGPVRRIGQSIQQMGSRLRH